MSLDLGEDIQRRIYLGTYEPRDTTIVRRWLRAGMTFVDVGANVGYYTVLAASRVAKIGRVIAVEPSTYAYSRLSSVVRVNGLNQVRTIHAALGAESGYADLYVSPCSARLHSPTMVPHSGGDPSRVEVRTLDEVLDECEVGVVDLVKIDVEGYEPHILRGGVRSLAARRIRAVLCEFNDFWLRRLGSSPQEVHEMLTAAGFVDQNGSPRFSAGCLVNRFLVLKG
jgi:FkbM family methyltransferase